MASINDPKLEITPDDASRQAQVRVTCELHFTDQEIEVMRQTPNGLFYQLFCWLMGEDLGEEALINADDWLYSFETKSFPDGPIDPVQAISFETTLGYNVLNEDIIGQDEIYAKFLLQGWRDFRRHISRAKTNTVNYEFG
jgi:hypothetical protein